MHSSSPTSSALTPPYFSIAEHSGFKTGNCHFKNCCGLSVMLTNNSVLRERSDQCKVMVGGASAYQPEPSDSALVSACEMMPDVDLKRQYLLSERYVLHPPSSHPHLGKIVAQSEAEDLSYRENLVLWQQYLERAIPLQSQTQHDSAVTFLTQTHMTDSHTEQQLGCFTDILTDTKQPGSDCNTTLTLHTGSKN